MIEENNKTENNERAVCYVRLSQDDSKNPSLSPANQVKICKEYAESKGDTIAVVYSDVNKSGSNLQRSGFQNMMNDAKKGLFKRIYLKTWDRLSRDLVDMEHTIKNLAKSGIVVISSDGHNDPKERQVRALVAQWTLDDLREKSENLHKLKIKEQVPLNPPPFGYKMSKKYKHYIVEGEKAETVKEIFERKSYGESINSIAQDLRMNVTTVYNILKNKTYLGYNVYRGEIIKGKHQAIISEELFNKCQKKDSRAVTWVLKENKPKKFLN